MFSGLVQYLVPLASNQGETISILAPKKAYKKGESISINGVCLTVAKMKPRRQSTEIWFDLTPETLAKTSMAGLKIGSMLNFERSLTLQDFLGGHIVQGHVDGMGSVKKIEIQGANKQIWFSAPEEILRYVVPKGSVTINGVSLTAVKADLKEFCVSLIPVTLKETNMGALKVGDPVNLEADIMAKYVERFIKK